MEEEFYNDDSIQGSSNGSQRYIITDILGFCRSTRQLVIEELKNQTTSTEKLSEKEINSFITLKQVEEIARDNSLEKDSEQIVIDINAYEEIYDQISNIIFGSALSKLAAEGFLEVAWDDNLNDMVFWVSDKAKKEFGKN